MRQRKTAYELASSQIDTPNSLVNLVWKITDSYRSGFSRVLDLGSGDGRFAFGEKFQAYDGVEIDETRIKKAILPDNARVHEMCAFEFPGRDYSLCIQISNLKNVDATPLVCAMNFICEPLSPAPSQEAPPMLRWCG